MKVEWDRQGRNRRQVSGVIEMLVSGVIEMLVSGYPFIKI